MATKSFEYNSVERIYCGECPPFDVILCLDSTLVVSIPCPEGEGDYTQSYGFITATLVSEEEVTGSYSCSNHYWKYVFQYDDTLITPGYVLTGDKVTGIFCKNCLTDYIENVVGQEVTLTAVEGETGLWMLTSQHGCESFIEQYTLLVTDTESVNLTIGATIQQTLSADVIISDDAGQCLEVRADGLYVPCGVVEISGDAGNILVMHGDGLYVECCVEVSSDEGNCLELRGNGLYSPCAAVEISALEGNCATNEVDGLYVPCIDEWIEVSDAWTYLSSVSVTVPAGASTTYQFGDKIRFKQGGGYKYYYIYQETDTTLNLTGGTDYTVANAAITEIAYSRVERPLGFPQYFNWTPTISVNIGSFNAVVINKARFCLSGLMCHHYVDFSGTYVPAAGPPSYFLYTLPIPATFGGIDQGSGSGYMSGDPALLPDVRREPAVVIILPTDVTWGRIQNPNTTGITTGDITMGANWTYQI